MASPSQTSGRINSFEIGHVYRNVYCLDVDWKACEYRLHTLRENEYALMPIYNEKHKLLFGESPTDLAEIYTVTYFSNWIDVTHIYNGLTFNSTSGMLHKTGESNV